MEPTKEQIEEVARAICPTGWKEWDGISVFYKEPCPPDIYHPTRNSIVQARAAIQAWERIRHE